MGKIKWTFAIFIAVFTYLAWFSDKFTVSAQEINLDLSNPEAIANYINLTNSLDENSSSEKILDGSLEQITNVDLLTDVAPTDWAYEALRSLVNRYGCIVGYPNLTYHGSQALTRYEFAAGLNSCLDRIERLIASSGMVTQEDLNTMQRLSQEFAAELATLGGRLDNLESRTAFLEDNTFSTTTTLQGEVAFNIAQAFGEDLDSQVVFSDRVRLQLVSSFTGRDNLFIRLTAGNIGNSFQDETGTREGRFAYDGANDNDIELDRLLFLSKSLSNY